MHIKSITMALFGATVLSGCMSDVSQTSTNVMGIQSIAGVQRAAQTQPTQQDLARSCSDVQKELDQLYARSEAINKAETARQRKTNLTNGLLNAGLSVVGADAIASAGSAQAISNVGTATTLAGAAVNSSGASGPTSQTYTQAMALAERSALLERVKLSKGC